MPGTLLEPTQFAPTVLDGTSHLPAKVRGHPICHREHGIDGRQAEPGSLLK
ncbi:MAG: hypothetical protein R3C02_01810 [Planctomycetaceae bacterium]